jgi:hypothetical protein
VLKPIAKTKLKGGEIGHKIFDYLGQVELTATTEMVASAVGVAWCTA